MIVPEKQNDHHGDDDKAKDSTADGVLTAAADAPSRHFNVAAHET